MTIKDINLLKNRVFTKLDSFVIILNKIKYNIILSFRSQIVYN